MKTVGKKDSKENKIELLTTVNTMQRTGSHITLI